MKTIIKTENSELRVIEIKEELAGLLLDIIKTVDKELIENLEIIVYGKVCYQHRNIGFFSNVSRGYAYSKKIVKAKPLDHNLSKLLDWVNNFLQTNYNGILINKYKNGSDYIGKHSDDEKELDPKGGVSAISFGASRKFRIRDKKTGKIITDYKTGSCEIIQMLGDFQKEFTHEIPIEKKVQNERFSFTFRVHNL